MYLKVHLSSLLTVEWTKQARFVATKFWQIQAFGFTGSRIRLLDPHPGCPWSGIPWLMCCGPDQQEVGELVSALSDLSVNRLRQRGTCQIFIFRFSCFYCSVFWFCWSSCHLCWIKNCAMCRWTDMMSFSRQRWLMWRSGGKTLPKCIQIPEMLKPSGPWEVPRHPFFFLGERLALQIFRCQEQLARTVPRHVLDCHRCRNQFDPFWCDPSSAKSWAHPSCRTKPSSSVPRAQNLNIGLVLWQSKDPVLQGDLGVNSRMLWHLYTVFRHILWNT